uniref:Uncharacterized protein n=1 Tax=Rhizophora mucronata TaxID=61149 RepID=A0A2P2IYV7_RHIMU
MASFLFPILTWPDIKVSYVEPLGFKPLSFILPYNSSASLCSPAAKRPPKRRLQVTVLRGTPSFNI